MQRTARRGAVMAGLVLALAGCGEYPGIGPSPTATLSAPAVPRMEWPAPANAMGLTVDAGLVPEPKEQLAFHAHAHLDVFIDGTPIIVPAGIGINIEDPGVKRFENPLGYGGIEQCAQPCISPLHTHGEDGILHTESATAKQNTLGQFFIEWGVELSATCVGQYCSPAKAVAFYVDGVQFTGDPSAIELTDRKEIAIVIGTPPAQIPSTGNFSQA